MTPQRNRSGSHFLGSLTSSVDRRYHNIFAVAIAAARSAPAAGANETPTDHCNETTPDNYNDTAAGHLNETGMDYCRRRLNLVPWLAG
jgi:hypothetical protein